MSTAEKRAPIPAALYARKSADEKLSPRSDVQTQVREIRAWAERNGFDVVIEYVDDAWKGWDLSRPQLQAMMEAARRRDCPFKAIIVSEWDRFMRRMGAAMEAIEELEAHGIELISVRGGRTQSRNERIGRNASLFVAETENEIRAGHSLAGQIRWATEGYSMGGTPPYGYRRQHVEDTKGVMRIRYTVQPEEAAVVRDIYKSYAAGESIVSISRRTGLGMQHIQYILVRNQEKYLGSMTFNHTRYHKRYRKSTPKLPEEWTVCPNAHEAIVTPEMVEAVRKRYACRKK